MVYRTYLSGDLRWGWTCREKLLGLLPGRCAGWWRGVEHQRLSDKLTEDVFVSSDSAESVTDGIDAVAVPVRSLSGLANAQDTMPASVAGLSE